MCQARTCGRDLAQGPTLSAQKQWKSDVHVKLKPSQGEIATHEIQERKIIESAAI